MPWKAAIVTLLACAFGLLAYLVGHRLGLGERKIGKTTDQTVLPAQDKSARTALAQLKQRLDRLELSGSGESADSKSLPNEIRRLEARVAEIEASRPGEFGDRKPPSERHVESPRHRADDMRAQFASVNHEHDQETTATVRTLTARALAEKPELQRITWETVNCTQAWCLVEASLAEGTDFTALYPSLLTALGTAVDEVAFTLDPATREVTMSLSRPGHELPSRSE